MPASALQRAVISRLNRVDFAAFTFELLRSGYGDLIQKSDIGDEVYCRNTIWRSDTGEQAVIPNEHALYINHFTPTELFKKPNVRIDEVQILDTLNKVRRYYSLGPVTTAFGTKHTLRDLYLLLNTAESTAEDTFKAAHPQFNNLVKTAGLGAIEGFVGIGSIESFVEHHEAETEDVLCDLISSPSDGVAIGIHPNGVEVRPFCSEKPLFCGVTQSSLVPCESVYLSTKNQHDALLKEFESLLEPETHESLLEKFLVRHYQDIFGPQYDRIEVQMWLRFPELDITGRERRLDLFLRNSIKRDWDLFELKKPVRITTGNRDVPVFVREVHDAIEQVRNYSHLLSEGTVREHFAKEGIEYFEPSLHVVIGRTPQLDWNQWRRLLSNNSKNGLNILTYDDLLQEMKVRLADRENILKRGS